MSIFSETLKQMMDDGQIKYTDEAVELCERYYELVIEANKRTNLTRITSEAQAAQMHFYGAIELLKYVDIPPGASVIDIGTGAGFPGIPLKIVRGDIDMTLVDSAGKKTAFVKSAAEQVGIDVAVITARAEELNELRETFDVAVSRAVASLPVLTELCVPLIKVGGYFCAWKGRMYGYEVKDASSAISVMGCKVIDKHKVGEGAIIVMQKNKPTPDIYPRRFAKIKSDPL
ncbi:MAG: 16S rRNA (guanine(527)-N(7))-methyltransferase RsmG [Clostridia bacterium]|jgi:16S rRNA (guanine527-N7)-methyltransferase|nr:16S rRNA (guanine(527)-N(7))-methyltransferase RsmG [Clostridia bacterium]